MSAKDHLSRQQFPDDKFLHLYHGTTERASKKIDTEGLKANAMGLVYGSEDRSRAAKWARQKAAENEDSPMMVEFKASRDNVSKPWSQRHDWSHSGDVPVNQVHDITYLDEDE